MREVDCDIGRRSHVGELILVVDADNTRKLERFVSFNQLANDGSHAAIANNKYFGHVRFPSSTESGGCAR